MVDDCVGDAVLEPSNILEVVNELVSLQLQHDITLSIRNIIFRKSFFFFFFKSSGGWVMNSVPQNEQQYKHELYIGTCVYGRCTQEHTYSSTL